MSSLNWLTPDLQSHWLAVAPIFKLRTERDYDRAVRHLNELLDEVGMDECHPLTGLLDVLGTLIHGYEEQHHPLSALVGVELLRSLMREHALAPHDLSEFGSAAVANEILDSHRSINRRQMRLLAKRFHLSRRVTIIGWRG